MKPNTKRLTFYLLVALLLLTTGAAIHVWRTNYMPTVLWRGSGHELIAAATEAARSDIASGKPKVCLAGTFGVWPVGVMPEFRPLIQDIPEQTLPNGCSNAFAARAILYANAYNTVIIAHLRSQQSEPVELHQDQG